MNLKASKGMVVVAAVVALGMVGSQLNFGGLSGQAAGGEAAGCGGDAYYDEDLGALVDSEGNILDESGATAQVGGTHDAPYDSHAAGAAMDGQSLVTVIRPVNGAADELDGLSRGEANFDSTAHVSVDGRYALVTFSSEDYAELNQVQLLRNDDGEWTTVWAFSSPEDGLPISGPSIADVSEGDNGDLVRFQFDGTTLLEYDVEPQTLRTLTRDEEQELIFSAAAEAGYAEENVAKFQLLRMADMSVVDFIQTRVRHPWLVSFVEEQYGAGTQFRLSTSFNNQMMVALSNGGVLAIQGCELGNTPINADGELVCVSCEEAGGCDNVFNEVDMLDRSITERLETTIELRDELASLDRLSPRIDTSMLEKGRRSNHADGNAWYTTQTIYENNFGGQCNGSVCWKKSGNKVYIRGSDDLSDWAYNIAAVVSSDFGWGRDGNKVKNAVGCNSYHWIGHSRGGAIAAWLANKCGGSVTTYGAPSTGKSHSGTRYVHENDPVQALGSRGTRHETGGRGMFYECVDRRWWGCKKSDWREKGIGTNIGWTGSWNPLKMYRAHVYGYTGNDGWDEHKWD